MPSAKKIVQNPYGWISPVSSGLGIDSRPHSDKPPDFSDSHRHFACRLGSLSQRQYDELAPHSAPPVIKARNRRVAPSRIVI